MKHLFTLLAMALLATSIRAQELSTSPAFVTEASTPITITLDATKGNAGLLNYANTSDIYVHMGVITNKSTSSSDWKHAPFTWATTPTTAHATYLGSNKWSFTITGGLRSFFSMTDATETVQKIAILFRNGAGSTVQRNADGSDMYIPVYTAGGLNVRIDNPFKQPLYLPVIETLTKKVGDAITITANASVSSTINLYLNGSLLATQTGATTATTTTNIAVSGNQTIIAQATSGGTTVSDTVTFVVASANTVAALPAGTVDGINYDPNDNTVATMVLYAPSKNNIFVLGDFNNWAQSANYQMNITPDGNRYWLKLTGLTPGTEYAYQYLIDGSLKVADYNTEKVLDPWNDKYLAAGTYPNLKAYPTAASGIVSVLQTAKPAYNWQVTNFTKPNKHNLLVYELLLRDFSASQTYQAAIDSLGYLKKLGINCIELMPINEFEGNNSWGYNPSFYFAPDKNYGTEYDVRKFVDACHAQGIAVVMDIALNHSFGLSPMVQMYWDAANSKPAANNPWFYTDAHHPFNVGYDINHNTQATRDFVDRVVTHWLTNYKIDGFRWDLAKGFTPADMNTQDVATWSAYSQGRVDIWKRIYDKMQAVAPGSYCILEHLGDNGEEAALANYGMMPWGNMSSQYQQSVIGYPSTNADLSYSFDRSGYTQRNLVAYQESHDEERLAYKQYAYGANSGIKYDLATQMKRDAAAAALFAVMPGPKMIWQFGEVGYDKTIGLCSDGTTINQNSCKTDPKPILWSYYQNTYRKGLYDVYAKLFNMRNVPSLAPTFTDGSLMFGNLATYSLNGDVKQLTIYYSNMSVVSFANLGTGSSTSSINFPTNGTWYRVVGTVGNPTITIANNATTFTLSSGDYAVFTNIDVNAVLPVSWVSFTAQKGLNNAVNLAWSVSNEINNNHYDIERSTDGTSFSYIGSVPASTSVFNAVTYNYTDISTLGGTVYYRIKQVDNDGKYTFSKVVSITADASKTLWHTTYSNSTIKIAVQANVNKMDVVLYDMSGKALYQQTAAKTVAGQQINIPAKQFAKGVYLLRIQADNGNKTEKIVVE
ncbi:alpha-amylase family glycosyl hydrolase [Parasediminibacterium sp. JCM 36343]|uniref:alpha-amylase family glycosyl hydrolase n=1 Tax=Parasediminibacterium sp. JCM 36343 TaxID=3374279 RepID=UPI00397DEAA5